MPNVISAPFQGFVGISWLTQGGGHVRVLALGCHSAPLQGVDGKERGHKVTTI